MLVLQYEIHLLYKKMMSTPLSVPYLGEKKTNTLPSVGFKKKNFVNICPLPPHTHSNISSQKITIETKKLDNKKTSKCFQNITTSFFHLY
jgi:hypothetical protein